MSLLEARPTVDAVHHDASQLARAPGPPGALNIISPLFGHCDGFELHKRGILTMLKRCRGDSDLDRPTRLLPEIRVSDPSKPTAPDRSPSDGSAHSSRCRDASVCPRSVRTQTCTGLYAREKFQVTQQHDWYSSVYCTTSVAMSPKLAAFVVLASVAFVVATPHPSEVAARNDRGGGSGSTCSTGSLQCCQQTTTAGSPSASSILGLLGIVVQDVNALVGLDCSPITIIGVGSGDACSASTVCCEDNSNGGLISIGCIPITL